MHSLIGDSNVRRIYDIYLSMWLVSYFSWLLSRVDGENQVTAVVIAICHSALYLLFRCMGDTYNIITFPLMVTSVHVIAMIKYSELVVYLILSLWLSLVPYMSLYLRYYRRRLIHETTSVLAENMTYQEAFRLAELSVSNDLDLLQKEDKRYNFCLSIAFLISGIIFIVDTPDANVNKAFLSFCALRFLVEYIRLAFMRAVFNMILIGLALSCKTGLMYPLQVFAFLMYFPSFISSVHLSHIEREQEILREEAMN